MPAYAYTTTINREPQKVYGGELLLDLDGSSVTEAIAKLQNLALPPECVDSRVDISGSDDYTSVSVIWYKMETPEQTQARITRLEEYNQTVMNRRRAEYEQMKREFERGE